MGSPILELSFGDMAPGCWSHNFQVFPCCSLGFRGGVNSIISDFSRPPGSVLSRFLCRGLPHSVKGGSSLFRFTFLAHGIPSCPAAGDREERDQSWCPSLQKGATHPHLFLPPKRIPALLYMYGTACPADETSESFPRGEMTEDIFFKAVAKRKQ